MTHHIAICEVDHDEVELLAVDGADELVGHLGCRHLGLQVVGGHLGRSHKHTLLTLEGILATAVEEECHVGILLCLCDMELLLTLL